MQPLIASPRQTTLPYQTNLPFTEALHAKTRAVTSLQSRIRSYHARNRTILPSQIIERLNIPQFHEYTDAEKLGLTRAICWEMHEMMADPTKFNGFSKFVEPAEYYFKEESPTNSALKFEVVQSLCNEMSDLMTNIKKYHIDIKLLEKEEGIIRHHMHADISQMLCLEMNDLANDPKKWGKSVKSSAYTCALKIDNVHQRNHLRDEYEMCVNEDGGSIILKIKNPSKEAPPLKVKFKITTLEQPLVIKKFPHHLKINRVIQPLTTQQLDDFKLSLSHAKRKTIPLPMRSSKSLSTRNLLPIDHSELKKSIHVKFPYFLEMEKSGIILTIFNKRLKEIPDSINHEAVSLHIPYLLTNNKREGTCNSKIIRKYFKNYPKFDPKKNKMQKIMHQIAEAYGGHLIENERSRLPDASIETFFEELGEEWKKNFQSQRNARSLPCSTEKNVQINPQYFIKKRVGKENTNSLNRLETIQDQSIGDLLTVCSKMIDHPSGLSLKTSDFLNYFLDIVSTMIPQHENGIVHGNLTPDHIFFKVKPDGKITAFLDCKSADYMGVYTLSTPNIFLDTSTREGYLTPYTDCYSLAVSLLCIFFRLKNDKFLNSIDKSFDKFHIEHTRQSLMSGIVEHVIGESKLNQSNKNLLKTFFNSEFYFSKEELNWVLSTYETDIPEDKLAINKIIQLLHVYRKIFDLVKKIIHHSDRLKNRIDKNEKFIKIWENSESTLEEKQIEWEQITEHLYLMPKIKIQLNEILKMCPWEIRCNI